MNIGVIIACSVLIGIALLFPVTALLIGKRKLKKALRPVEFYPPRGYSPVDVLQAYYGHNADARNIINPLMLNWAERGLITIEEDCKRGLKLTKVADFVPPDFDGLPDITRRVRTNCEYEQRLFEKIFQDGDVFYTLAALDGARRTNAEFTADCNKAAKGTRTKITKTLFAATTFAATALMILVTLILGTAAHNMLYMAMIFPIVALTVCKLVRIEGQWEFFKYIFFGAWGGIPFIAVIAVVAPAAKILLAVAGIAAVTINILAGKIDIRSQSDIAIYGRIDSFKTFLLEAEVARLELLVEENPRYFYDVLPYCYALDITEKLKPKFDRITMDGPSWYLGDLRDTLMF